MKVVRHFSCRPSTRHLVDTVQTVEEFGSVGATTASPRALFLDPEGSDVRSQR
jgi:hypothetical protein